MRLFVILLFLFQMIPVKTMDKPCQSFDAMKKRIEELKQRKEATQILAQQRLQKLKQDKLVLERNLTNEQVMDNCLNDYLEAMLLQGASLALEKATGYGYHYLKKEKDYSDDSESVLLFFSCINQIVCHPTMLKSLMHNLSVKRRIFSHRIAYQAHPADELQKLTAAIKKEAEEKRSITMQLIDECFGGNPMYNDSMADRIAFAAIGTVLLLPAVAVDVSKTAMSYVGLKK